MLIGTVKASKLDLMARGVAIDLLQIVKQVGLQCEAAEYEDLAGERSLPQGGGVAMVGAIEPSNDDTAELSMKAPMSVSKLADLG